MPFPHATTALIFFLILFFLIKSCVYIFLKPSIFLILPLSLIIAGAIGNLFDRVSYGEVVDFIHIKLGSFWEWYIFNIADTSVSIGMILFLIHSFYFQDESKEISA